MRFSPRTWSLLSLLLFVAAVFFWLKGNEYEARKKRLAPPVATTNTAGHVAHVDLLSTKTSGVQLARLSTRLTPDAPEADEEIDKLFPERLRNSKKPLRELLRDDHALLLANALIDTASGESIEVPAHLRSRGDPGSYIVQWSQPVDAQFRSLLAQVGAEIVSYVPNNAFYVKIDAAGAERLRSADGVQSVLPFEPYYKLQRDLLTLAVKNELLLPDTLLRVTLLPGSRETALEAVKTLGAQVIAEEPSPFGPQLIVHPPVDSLVALAGQTGVQAIERVSPRKLAADLSRIMLGIATNSSATNYLDLTGSNIWVNINDSGIDTNHPSLRQTPVSVPPAPLPMAGSDPEGHGTFVAGLIAGSGDSSPTNAPGSDTNALFRGIAPASKLLALPLSAGGGEDDYPSLHLKVLDSWLIESAARSNYITLRRTNSLISNNSWTYAQPVYDSAAARYDAAVRDAVSGLTGQQPLLFVFAAGNSGFGTDEGTSGQVDSIESPGTAKNVITVGALESYRLITNIFSTTTNTEIDEFSGVTNEIITTNYPFAALTDSSNQVASFSSRGNVGIGIEGVVGRFKPDVVAPGAMLVSARSSGWDFAGFNTNEGFGKAFFDLHQTNDIAPYRFDSGTTFAAAQVSGMLALIQQYFESVGPASSRGSLSPALMKAILINGSRSLTELYDLAVKSSGNIQGWGLPYLPNMLSSYSTNSHQDIDPKKLRLRFVDQSYTNALATGQSRTWRVKLNTNALVSPFRATLVWTDPPGNPAVGVKLVNDLDLIVTNVDSGTVFYGNNIPPEADFTVGVIPVAGDSEPVDVVNNVENVFIRNPKELGAEFTITVRARRVNVNSVSDFLFGTRNTNDIVQDFALVISSDMGSDLSTLDPYLPDLDVFDTFDVPTTTTVLPRPGLAILTNGLPLLEQRVAANPTLFGTNGMTNQWNFYVFTNATVSNSLVYAKAGTNMAFVTFTPPNLAKSRLEEADIDVYVSHDPSLTNLNPLAINSAAKSTERGGTETVVFTNAVPGQVYYVGVKSEDQQAAEFSLIGVSSDLPFEQDQNGPIQLTGVPIYSYVPDGTARKPVAGTLLAIGVSNRRVARTVVQNTVVHENYGDLVGVLSHGNTHVTLNNHAEVPLTTTNFVYDDNQFFPLGTGVRRTDGPGNLNDFAGQKIAGAWFLEMIDNSPAHTGRVDSLTITIDRLQDPLLSGQFITGKLRTNETLFFPIDVGPGVTNLAFQITNSAPMFVYFRQFELPQTNLFDLKLTSNVPGITFSFPTTNSAPLAVGTHYVALQNPSAIGEVTFRIRVDFGFGIRPGDTFNFAGQAPRPTDDASTNTTIFVQNDKLVARAQVSVHFEHPRMSDLALSLISPQGTRVLLSENRGGTNGGFGATVLVTNATSTNLVTAYTTFTDNTNLALHPIKFGVPLIAQNRTGVGVVSSNSFETATPGQAFPGLPIEAPWEAYGFPEVISRGAFHGTNAIEIIGTGVPGAESGILQSLATQSGRTYRVSFASRTPGRDYLYWTERIGGLTNSGTNYLRRMQLGTANVETLLTNSAAVGAFGGVSVDPLGGFVYSGDRRFLFRTDLLGRQRTNLVATRNAVADVEFDPANNWIYWSESGPFTRTNSIRRVRPGSRTPETLFELQLGSITGIAVDAARETLYYTLSLNTGRDTIQAMDLRSRQRRVVATLPSATVEPFDIDFDPMSQTFVFNEVGTRSLWRMGRNGAGLTRVSTNAFDIINGIAIDTGTQRIIYNTTNTINAVFQNGIGVTPLVRSRSTVYYQDVAHGMQTGPTSGPLVAQVILGTVTNSLIPSADWITNSFYYVGTGRRENLLIQAVEGGLWIDAVVVERVADTFLLPEEPLASIVGERSVGEWRLEVQDTRTGALLPAGSFDWKLDLHFADPAIFAETLTGGSRFSIATRSSINSTNRFTPGMLKTNQVHYLIIQPCAGAQNLSILLQGVRNFGAIDLLADTSGIPTGNPETDDFFPLANDQNPPSANGLLQFRLSDKLPAPAHLTSKPIFVAIRNRFQDMTNVYNLFVTSDGNCSGGPITTSFLSANQTEIGGLASASEYSASQMGLHAFSVPPGAEAVTLSVEGDADVSIIAQKDQPPTTGSFSHSQNIPGAAMETLTISADSGVPLTPGLWYVRVLNNSDSAVSYAITATGDLAAAPEELISVNAEIVDGQVRINWNSAGSETYELQSSIDLLNWETVTVLPEGTSNYVLPDLAGAARFFRVLVR